jgi:hypothetical protein
MLARFFVLLAAHNTDAPRTQIGRFLSISGNGVLYLIGLSEERAKTDPAFAALVLEGQSRLRERGQV